MKSTRDRILQTLLRQPHTTINELAKAVGINIAGGTESVDPTQVAGKIAGTGDVGAAESAEDEKDTDAGTDSKASRVGTAAA